MLVVLPTQEIATSESNHNEIELNCMRLLMYQAIRVDNNSAVSSNLGVVKLGLVGKTRTLTSTDAIDH